MIYKNKLCLKLCKLEICLNLKKRYYKNVGVFYMFVFICLFLC